MKLKIASYNVRHCAEGIEAVAAVLRNLGAQIVGVQEIDQNNDRSPEDQPALLAAAAGFPYYRFCPAIDYKGGKYGTLILSVFPIESFAAERLFSGEKEGRAVGHAVLQTPAGNVDFFNTHLSYEAKELRDVQFAELAKMMAPCPSAILTGDFNTQDFAEFAPLGDVTLCNRADRRMVTFPGHQIAIDNIIFPKNRRELDAGTVTDSHSDHYLLWTEVEL